MDLSCFEDGNHSKAGSVIRLTNKTTDIFATFLTGKQSEFQDLQV